MSCFPKCMKTASTDSSGQRIMVSQGGNAKFPADTPHPRCPECAKEECAQHLAEIAKAFPDSEEALFQRFEKAKKKGV